MGKRDLLRATRIPRFTDSDYQVHGSMIVPHTIPPAAMSVDRLSAITANLGNIETADLWLGGPLNSFIHMGNITGDTGESEGLKLEVANPQGQRYFYIRADDNPALTIGLRPTGGEFPIRVDADGNVVIQSSVVIMSDIARTLLEAGVIDLIYGDERSYEQASTAIRIAANQGIVSKYNGTQSVKWDSADAALKFGEFEEVQGSAQGLTVDADRYGVYGVKLTSDYQSFLGYVGALYGDVTADEPVYIHLRAQGGTDGRNQSVLQLGAYALNDDENQGSYTGSYINVISGRDDFEYGPGQPMPGIHLNPTSLAAGELGYVTVRGRLHPLILDMNPNDFEPLRVHRFLPRRFDAMPEFVELEERELAVVDEGPNFVRLIYRPVGAYELAEFTQDTST